MPMVICHFSFARISTHSLKSFTETCPMFVLVFRNSQGNQHTWVLTRVLSMGPLTSATGSCQCCKAPHGTQ